MRRAREVQATGAYKAGSKQHLALGHCLRRPVGCGQPDPGARKPSAVVRSANCRRENGRLIEETTAVHMRAADERAGLLSFAPWQLAIESALSLYMCVYMLE